MHNVPPENLAQLLALPLYKMLVLGDDAHAQTIANVADTVVPNGNLPNGAPTRTVVHVTGQAERAAVQARYNLPALPPTPDIITACLDGAKCDEATDHQPDDLTDPVILDAYFNQAVAQCP